VDQQEDEERDDEKERDGLKQTAAEKPSHEPT
jgi:hypothetical protein